MSAKLPSDRVCEDGTTIYTYATWGRASITDSQHDKEYSISILQNQEVVLGEEDNTFLSEQARTPLGSSSNIFFGTAWCP